MTGSPRPALVAAVYGILTADGRVLLMRRSGTGYRDGQLGLPAGHLEGGEDALRALRRELQEELAITVDPAACDLALVVHRAPEHPGDGEYLDLFFTVHSWHAPPPTPSPPSAASWCGPAADTLPVDVVDYVAGALGAVDRGERLLLHGWT